HNTPLVYSSVRHVNRALPRPFGEGGLLACADDADNCKQLRVVFFVPERDPLAERAAVRPGMPGQIFVHYTDAFRAVGICRGEEASFAQVNTEGREVLAVNGIGIMAVHWLTGRWQIALRCD